MITKESFVADQLRGISPGVDWNVSGIDRSFELARILVRAGVTDLWALKPKHVVYKELMPEYYSDITESSDGTYHPASIQTRNGIAFDYYGRTIGFLGTPDRQDSEPALKDTENGFLIAWSAEGHGNVSYAIAKNSQTGQLEIRPVWASSSDAGYIRQSLVTFVSFFAFAALPLAGVSIGAQIGSAVVPSTFAAAYPGITAAIGNIALSAALNGGDIKQSIVNAATSGVAGQVGGLAELASSSEFVGNVTSAATYAAIQGNSIKDAVAMSLLRHGATGMDEFFSFSVDPSAYDAGFDFSQNVDTGWNDAAFDAAIQDPIFTFDVSLADTFQISDFTIASDSSFALDPVSFDPFALPVAASDPPPKVNSQTPPPNSPAWNPVSIVNGITQSALAALSVVKAYRSLDTPQIQTTARVARPDGSVSVIGNNGLIQTRDASGRITAGKPPVGIPQATTSGNFIVNNGDGSYDVVSPSGQRRTMQYTGEAAKSEISMPLILGAVGVGALFLFARR